MKQTLLILEKQCGADDGDCDDCVVAADALPSATDGIVVMAAVDEKEVTGPQMALEEAVDTGSLALEPGFGSGFGSGSGSGVVGCTEAVEGLRTCIHHTVVKRRWC
jgi:hypothetical protein